MNPKSLFPKISPVSSAVKKGSTTFNRLAKEAGCISLIILLISLADPSFAQTKTWYGGTGNWDVAGNWSPSGVPSSTNDVTISSGKLTIPAPFPANAKSVLVQGGAELEVAASASLTTGAATGHGIRVTGPGSKLTNAGTVTITGSGGSAPGLANNGNITNNGTIIIPASASINYTGVQNYSTFTNNAGATISVQKSKAGYPVIENGGTLSNNGTINLGTDPSASLGSGILAISTITNSGTITIDKVLAGGLLVHGAPNQFQNNTGGTLKGTGSINADAFQNNGGTLAPGYSPGKQTFNSFENFSNSTMLMEINGTATAGVNYDQIVVNGTATLGGTLTVSIGYSPANGDYVTIVNATAISGTFSTVTVPSDWYVLYNHPGPGKVSMVYCTSGPAPSWIGGTGDWNVAANWCGGNVPASTDNVTISSGKATIPAGFAANAKSVTISGEAELAVLATASLTTGAATGRGIQLTGTGSKLTNSGTVTVINSGSEYHGIRIESGGSISNSGTIEIPANASIGKHGISNVGTITNNAGATIRVQKSGTGNHGIINLAGATINNNGLIEIPTTASIGSQGFSNSGTLTNNAGATISVQKSGTSSGIVNGSGGSINNSGTIEVPASASIGQRGISNNSTITNYAGAIISVQKSASGNSGIHVLSGATIINNGTINIGTDPSGSIGLNGIQADGTITNTGTIAVDKVAGGSLLVSGTTADQFQNNTGGTFKGTGGISATAFQNNGGTLAPGYSPGIQTFDGGENFSNSTMLMEINGTATAGVNYDQIVVNGTATLGGTLTVSIGYSPANGDYVTIVDATAISGTFSTVTVPSDWYVLYNHPGPGKASMVYCTSGPAPSWIGGTGDWNVAANWCGGNVPASTDNVTISSGKATTPAGFAANAKSVTISGGAELAVLATASLTTGAASGHGILVTGTGSKLTNVGTVTITNSGSGANGLRNESGGIVTNSGTINIGTDPSGSIGSNGIQADGTITNSGTITVDKVAGGSLLVAGSTADQFKNNTGGTFNGTGSLSATAFQNNGGTLAPGYSPGIQTFDGSENFSGSILSMEVNGTATAGVNYDQIVVNGTATLGGTLTVSVGYSPANGDFVTIVDATAISGTFSAVSAPSNWYVLYNYPGTGKVSMRYCNSGAGVWMGGAGDWNVAANWCDGSVPASTGNVTISSGKATIPAGFAANAKSVTISGGAELEIAASASLTTGAAVGHGIRVTGTVSRLTNAGTVTITGSGPGSHGLFNESGGIITNTGTISIPVSAGIGESGISNTSSFTNSAAGTLSVQKSGAGNPGIHNTGNLVNSGSINLGTAPAASIAGDGFMNSGGSVQNNAGASITVGQSGSSGLVNNNSGFFINTGNIVIPVTASIGDVGFNNAAYLQNDAGASISVGSSSSSGILNDGSGNIDNLGTIAIPANASIGHEGILNSGTITNNTGASISAGFSSFNGILNDINGSINNFGTIAIPANASIGHYGILNSGTLNNNTGATVSVQKGIAGITNDTGGEISNSGTIVIPATASFTSEGISNSGTLTNNTGATISVHKSTDTGIFNAFFAVITNSGTIEIPATANIGQAGISNGGTITNNTGATISVQKSTVSGILNGFLAVITNSGTIEIPATASIGHYGIENNGATLTNNAGGIISVQKSGTGYHGLSNLVNSTVNNSGIIDIGTDPSAIIGASGIQADGTITNSGTITVDKVAGGSQLVSGTTADQFQNNSGGIFKGTGSISAIAFQNNGGTLAPGYSPGIQTFDDSEDFSNSTMFMEINGTAVAGVNYDQIVVNGTATLGGTLTVSVNYSPANGNQVTILDATAISGTFSGTNLPSGWILHYNYPSAGKVSVSFGVLPVELMYFRASVEGENRVRLDWRTASEKNNEGYEVQRSTDAKNWENIGFVPGNGDSYIERTYSFPDDTPFNGVNYYRLRQIDFDGNFEFSPVVSANIQRAMSIRLYPNPAFDVLHLVAEAGAGYEVIDGTGKRVMAGIFDGQPLQVGSLVPGFYYLKSGGHVIRFVKA